QNDRWTLGRAASLWSDRRTPAQLAVHAGLDAQRAFIATHEAEMNASQDSTFAFGHDIFAEVTQDQIADAPQRRRILADNNPPSHLAINVVSPNLGLDCGKASASSSHASAIPPDREPFARLVSLAVGRRSLFAFVVIGCFRVRLRI